MPSFRQLLAEHAPLLLIDAASSRVQVGWFPNRDPRAAIWTASDEETGIGLFRCVDLLRLDLADAKSFVFCEGPGSVLGVRTCAMAVRTWNVISPRPILSYCSLALVAQALGRPDLSVIADARRELWHRLALGEPLRRVPAAELSGPLAMPGNFRTWSTPPPGVEQVPYDLSALFPRVLDAELFKVCAEPDAFLHEEPSYVTWTPKIHRGPESTRALR
jgi:tRNA threonylcarbamoyladenosine biosynthesis protein TsaB